MTDKYSKTYDFHTHHYYSLYYLPSKNTYLLNKMVFFSILQLFVYLEHRRNTNDRKIASEMMVYFKLVSLGQSEILVNKNSGCLFVKTI